MIVEVKSTKNEATFASLQNQKRVIGQMQLLMHCTNIFDSCLVVVQSSEGPYELDMNLKIKITTIEYS